MNMQTTCLMYRLNNALRALTIFFLPMFFGQGLLAQQSEAYQDPAEAFNTAIELYQKEKYGAAQELFGQVVEHYGEMEHTRKTNAEFYRVLCAMELFNQDAKELVAKFIKEHKEANEVKKAYFLMGIFEYRQQKYRRALEWFEKVALYDLSTGLHAEYHYKTGHSYFLTSDYDKAIAALSQVKDTESKYAIPATYFYGHIMYERKKYETALKAFESLADNEHFAVLVPYYICQIYFYQEYYDKIIDYAPPLLEEEDMLRKAEISRIIGEAYYQKGMYAEAIPYLEGYHEEGKGLGRDDYYVLGFSYYNADEWEKAAEMFEETVTYGQPEEIIIQNAYYFLASCYINMNQKQDALEALDFATRSDSNATLKEDAMFTYAKLTYELSYSPFNEAIRALERYIETYPNSKRADEAYDFLARVYMTTKNYKAALESLDKIKSKSREIKEAYQRVAFFRALELFSDIQYAESVKLFTKSLNYSSYDSELKAMALYWRGEAYYRTKQYEDAVEDYKAFQTSPGAHMHKEYVIAQYNLGYALLKQEQYEAASTWFRKYINKMRAHEAKMTADAYIRTGDCFFMMRDYKAALDYYQKAVEMNKYDVDYALFQVGITLGLTGNAKAKIDKIKKLVLEYKNSDYYDDALFELGRSYMEGGDNGQAVKMFDQIVEKHPNSSYVKKALVNLGLIHYNKGENEKALAYYQQVVENYPGSEEAGDALPLIENIYVDMGEVDAYLAYKEKIGSGGDISENKKDSLLYMAAENMYMKGNCERSAEMFKQYVEEFPNGNFLLNAHYYKADCNYRLENYAGALESFAYVVEQPRNPFSEEAMLMTAEIHFMQENYPSAIARYRQLAHMAETPANRSRARNKLLLAYMKTDNYPTAVEMANEILGEEKLDEAHRRQASFIKGKAYFLMDSMEMAMPILKEISYNIKTKEGSEAKYLLAYSYRKTGKPGEAINEVRNFSNMSTPHQYWLGKSLILVAEIFDEQEKTHDAIEILDMLLNKYTNTEDGIIARAETMKAELQAKLRQIQESRQGPEDIEIDFEENQNGQ